LALKKRARDELDQQVKRIKEQLDDALPVELLKAQPADLGGALQDLKKKYQTLLDAHLVKANAEVVAEAAPSMVRRKSMTFHRGDAVKKATQQLDTLYNNFKTEKLKLFADYNKREL